MSWWFLNYLPFKLKCSIGSKTKKWKGKLKSKDYEKWIEQGIVGATYKEIYTNLCHSKWDTSQDMIQKEYRGFIFINSKNLAKRAILLIYANAINNLYCKPNNFPSLAAGPSLQCSFIRMAWETGWKIRNAPKEDSLDDTNTYCCYVDHPGYTLCSRDQGDW